MTWLPPDITAPIATARTAGRSTNVPESVQPVVAFDEPVTGVDASSPIRTSTPIWLDAP